MFSGIHVGADRLTASCLNVVLLTCCIRFMLLLLYVENKVMPLPPRYYG